MSVSFVRRTAAVALALPLLLSGCTEDDPVPKMPASSSPSSPTSEPTSDQPVAPVEPTLPPEARGKGNAAAEAFVRHYYATVNYAQATGDTVALKKLGLRSCTACQGGLTFITKIYASGGTNQGGDYTVESTSVDGKRTVSDSIHYTYLSVVTTNTQQTVTGAGDMDRTYKAGKSDLTFELVHDPTGWHVSSWGAK